MQPDETDHADAVAHREAEVLARVRETARRIEERVRKVLDDTGLDQKPIDGTDETPPLPPAPPT